MKFDRDLRHSGEEDPSQPGAWGHDDRVPSMAAPAPEQNMDSFDHRHGLHDSNNDHRQDHSPADPPDAQNSLVAVIGGSATAIGETSTAIGCVENFAGDLGDYSIAMGEAIFQASACSSEPGSAAAVASTFLEVSGADFIFAHESGGWTHGAHDAWAYSELDYFSIDFHGWSSPHGTIVIDVHHAFSHGQPIGQDPFYGNFAQVLALAETHGADTLSATFTNALTVENHFSLVNAVKIVAL